MRKGLDLEESRDFWQESANHDKWQALASFAVAGCGVSAATAGALAFAEGEPVLGVPGLVIGIGLFMGGYRSAKQEISSAMEMKAQAAVRQNQLNELDGN